jgi:hypothetical protein
MNTLEARDPVIRLIKEGIALDPLDLEQFYRWVDRSFQALEPFSASRQQFDKYCRCSTDSPQIRTLIGVQLLKLTVVKQD